MSDPLRKPILNPVVARWFDTWELKIPDVDCANCTLSLKNGPAALRWFRFKCCTFQPFLANFYCGALLEEGFDPLDVTPGKAVLKPLGVVATQEFREHYYQVENDKRGEEHLCSFYDRTQRGCKIWKYRPGECSLYYCDQGQAEAREKLSKKVFVLESSIAQMALAYYGLSRGELDDQVEFLNTPKPRMTSLEPERAREIYRFAWKWLNTVEPEEVLTWVDFDKLEVTE